MHALRRLALFFAVPAAVVLITCGGNNNPAEGGDAGVDAGPSDAGLPDAGAKDAGPQDAGDPDFSCSVAAQTCDAGQSCLLFQKSSGKFGAACFAGACDLVKQDCADGEKCTYVTAQEPGSDGGSVRACVGEGTAQEGEGCVATASSNSCAKGLTCVAKSFADGGTRNVCFRFCDSNADCSGGQACFLTLQPKGNPERPLVCDTPCDLFLQDCPPGRGCYPGPVVPGCYPEGSIALGAACTWSDECVKGAACVGGHCRALCTLPAGTPGCTSGSCQPIDLSSVPDAGACL